MEQIPVVLIIDSLDQVPPRALPYTSRPSRCTRDTRDSRLL